MLVPATISRHCKDNFASHSIACNVALQAAEWSSMTPEQHTKALQEWPTSAFLHLRSQGIPTVTIAFLDKHNLASCSREVNKLQQLLDSPKLARPYKVFFTSNPIHRM